MAEGNRTRAATIYSILAEDIWEHVDNYQVVPHSPWIGIFEMRMHLGPLDALQAIQITMGRAFVRK
jgi:hypothetical protein